MKNVSYIIIAVGREKHGKTCTPYTKRWRKKERKTIIEMHRISCELVMILNLYLIKSEINLGSWLNIKDITKKKKTNPKLMVSFNPEVNG